MAAIKPLKLTENFIPCSHQWLEGIAESGCTWSGETQFYVEKGFILGDKIKIKDTSFAGSIFFRKSLSENIGSIVNCSFSDCVFDTSVVARNSFEISHCKFEQNTRVYNCSNFSFNRTIPFFIDVPVGLSTGSRKVRVSTDSRFSEITRDCYVAHNKIKPLGTNSHEYNIIVRGATISGCCGCSSFFVGAEAKILSSTLTNAWIGAESLITTNSVIRNSIVLGSCSIEESSILFDSFVFQGSKLGLHVKVLESIVAPYSRLYQGEISHCLLGPLSGFNHTSTLTAAICASGKINVALGSILGSNHTGRKADQEIFIGEGIFFGLGARAKYPINLLRASYSLIAADVTLPAQEVTFPFSLILPPSDNIGKNAILPGWMLYGSVYSIYRNQFKYKKRSNSYQNADIDARVFKPRTMLEIYSAYTRLVLILQANKFGSDIFLTRENVPGVGACVTNVRFLEKGIQAYKLYLTFYALVTYNRIATTFTEDIRSIEIEEALIAKIVLEQIGKEEIRESWEKIAKLVVVSHFKSIKLEIRKANLKKEIERMSTNILNLAIDSRQKDSVRGNKIMPAYDLFHEPLAEDDIILQMKEHFNILKEEFT